MFVKRYHREAGAAFAGYVVVLLGSYWFLLHGENIDPRWQTALVLSPVLPFAGLGWVILRQFRRLDELQVRMQFEAAIFAVWGTALLSIGYGFLETVGYPKLSMFWVVPIMGLLWILASLHGKKWRYR